MKLQQKQIDRINDKYPDLIDEAALNELIKREFNVFMVGTETITKESETTDEWKDNLKAHYNEYHNLSREDLEYEIRYNFLQTFQLIFPRFFT